MPMLIASWFQSLQAERKALAIRQKKGRGKWLVIYLLIL